MAAEAAQERAAAAPEDEDDTAAAVASGAQSAWRRVWPPLAVAYVLYAWFLAVTRPNILADVVLTGTGYTVVAVLLLLAALRLMKRAPDVRAPMPKAVRAGLPKLPPRADQIATIVAYVVVLALVLTATGLILTGWDWIDVAGWMAGDAAQTVFWRIASAALVTLFAAVLWAVTASWIDERLMEELTGRNVSARSRTLLALFRNAFTIVLVVLATMIALSQLGINIAPLLAGAGVIGLAVGFGAQSLVQDIITGTFIQLENAINEGDVVGVAGITGAVEKVTIRSVRIRTLDGSVHIIPFSSVDTVTNLTRDFSFHVAEIGAAYKEKVPDVKAAMEEAFARLKAEGEFAHDILAPLEMHGVTELGDSAVVVRARIKTLPGKQWGLGRRYTELVKDVFDERGIEIPFPHRQLMFPEGMVELLHPPRQDEPRDITPPAERAT
jgi:moderate conductance mechanosensitive channel